jgi:hypothetical protein
LKTFRSFLAVLMGLFFGGCLIYIVQAIGSQIFPLPPGVDPLNRESLRAAMANLPLGAFLFVLFSWLVGTLAGSWLATRRAPTQPLLHGGIVGAFLFAGSVMTLISLPHPIWFWVAAIALVPAASYVGSQLGAVRPPA